MLTSYWPYVTASNPVFPVAFFAAVIEDAETYRVAESGLNA